MLVITLESKYLNMLSKAFELFAQISGTTSKIIVETAQCLSLTTIFKVLFIGL